MSFLLILKVYTSLVGTASTMSDVRIRPQLDNDSDRSSHDQRLTAPTRIIFKFGAHSNCGKARKREAVAGKDIRVEPRRFVSFRNRPAINHY